MLTLEGGALAGLGLTFGHNECAGGGGEDEGLPRRRTFIAFLRFSMSFLVSCRSSSISRETLAASACS